MEEPTLAQRQADAIGTVAEAALAGGLDRGTAGDRYQVVLHVDAEALAEPADVPAGTSGGAAAESEPRAGGDRVPAETSGGAAAESEPRAGGDRVPAETSGGAASESEPRAGGDRVPAGTPATPHAASGGPGEGAPIHTEVSARAGRARRRRRTRHLARRQCEWLPAIPLLREASNWPRSTHTRLRSLEFPPSDRSARCQP